MCFINKFELSLQTLYFLNSTFFGSYLVIDLSHQSSVWLYKLEHVERFAFLISKLRCLRYCITEWLWKLIWPVENITQRASAIFKSRPHYHQFVIFLLWACLGNYLFFTILVTQTLVKNFIFQSSNWRHFISTIGE